MARMIDIYRAQVPLVESLPEPDRAGRLVRMGPDVADSFRCVDRDGKLRWESLENFDGLITELINL